MEASKHPKSRFGLRQEVIAMAATTAFAAIREFVAAAAAKAKPAPGGATPKPGPTEPYITATDLRERSRHAVATILKALKPWREAHEAVQDALDTLFNPKPEELRYPA